MAKLIIENLLDGLVKEHWQRPYTVKNGLDTQYASGIIDLLSNPNLIQPYNASLGAVTNSGGLSDSSGYESTKMLSIDDYTATFSSVAQIYFGQKDLIHRLNPNGQSMASDSDFPHQIAPGAGAHSAHTTFRVDDVVLYKVNDVPKLFYFYRDATDGDAGTFDLNTTFVANETVISGAASGAVLSKAFSIVAEVADNGFMYIGSGNSISKFDGTAAGGANGTFTDSVIDLESNYSIVDLKDWKSRMLVLTKKGVTSSNEIREYALYIWDRTSTSLSFEDIVLLNGVFNVSRIFFYNNVPCIFTQERVGNTGTISFRVFDGYRFNIKRILFDTSTSVAIDLSVLKVVAVQYGDGLIIPGQSGEIIFLQDPLGEAKMFKVGTLDLTGNDKILAGPYSATVGGYIYFLYRVAASSLTTIKYWGFGLVSGTGAGSFYSKVYQLPKLSRIKSMTVYYQPLTSTADKDVTINLYKNMSSTALYSTDFKVNYLNDGSRGYKHFVLGGEAGSNVNTIQLLLTYPSGETITNSLKFSRIEIEYEDTTKKV